MHWVLYVYPAVSIQPSNPSTLHLVPCLPIPDMHAQGLEIPKRVFPCATPAEVRSTLPKNTDVLAFQCRNPIHRWVSRIVSWSARELTRKAMLNRPLGKQRQIQVETGIWTQERRQRCISRGAKLSRHTNWQIYQNYATSPVACIWHLSPDHHCRAHYELFIRALDAPNVAKDGVCLVHPTVGPTQVRRMSSAASSLAGCRTLGWNVAC
jgi:hypothetical protein